MDPLHLITVCESSSKELTATGAKLAVRISGDSFFVGDEAFKKAAEVAGLVKELVDVGLADDDIRLQNISVSVDKKVLLKASSARYDLEIHCHSHELIGQVLAAIALRKKADLISIAWQYGDLDEEKSKLIQSATRAAKESAKAIAAALDADLLGVHRLSYEVSGLDTELHFPRHSDFLSGAGFAQVSRARDTSLDSLNLAHMANVQAQVTAEFLVDTFEPNTQSAASGE